MAVAGTLAAERLSEFLGEGDILTSHSQIGGALESYLLGMAGTGNHKGMVALNTEFLHHVVRHQHILVRNNPLDGGHHILPAEVHPDLFKMALEIRGGHHQQEGIGLGGDVVYVGRELDAVHIKGHISKICRIMAQTYEILDAVVAAHIPHYRRAVLQQQFRQGRGPASAAHNGHASRKILATHSFRYFLR